MARKDHMIYRMAYRMAMADGEISANEALILHLFQHNMGLTKAEIETLRQEATAFDYATLPAEFPERKDQLMLFETACLMAMLDGRSDPEEWELVIRLCDALDIDRPQAQDCLARARERLYKLADKHNLLPEIIANLERDDQGEPDSGPG